MAGTTREPLDFYLNLRYPFTVSADPEGYVVVFPDLPGCMTQVDKLDEIASAAEEVRTLWIETAYEQGLEIPLPSQTEEYSGKFNVRLPRSLHRSLVEAADREGVSLNQYVVHLLSRGDGQARLEHQIQRLTKQVEQLTTQVESLGARLTFALKNEAPSSRVRMYDRRGITHEPVAA